MILFVYLLKCISYVVLYSLLFVILGIRVYSWRGWWRVVFVLRIRFFLMYIWVFVCRFVFVWDLMGFLNFLGSGGLVIVSFVCVMRV